MIDYSKLRLSLKNLEEQYQDYLSLEKDLQIMKKVLPFDENRINRIAESIKESLIQRFEVSYDCLWKILAKYMEKDLGLPDISKSPKPIFRIAGENNLLPSSVEKWIEYVNLRIDTTHDYSGEKAQSCLDKVGDFLQDAISLYEKISKTQWS